jgi:hypothetical protein
MSFDFSTKSWISFHTYLPNFYIGENNFYYSGINGCCTNFTAILDTPDRSRIDKEEPILDMLVGVVQSPVLITTTTTSTSNPLFTTSTTTSYVPDCDFSISLMDELSCEIDGVGYITVPTPTTTTLCVRPTPLTTATFVEGYQIKGTTTPVIGTATAQEACSVAAFSFGTIDIIPISFNYEYSPLTNNTTSILNSQVYLGTSQNCTVVPDGWYSFQYEPGTVFYVENGFVKIEQPCIVILLQQLQLYIQEHLINVAHG